MNRKLCASSARNCGREVGALSGWTSKVQEGEPTFDQTDSDPRLQTQVVLNGAFGKKGASDFQQKFQQNDLFGTFLLMQPYVSNPSLTL